MIFKDGLGNELRESDLVSLAPGAIIGQIIKTESGLGVNSQPMIFVQVTLPLVAAPNGLIGGVVKAAQPQTAPAIST